MTRNFEGKKNQLCQELSNLGSGVRPTILVRVEPEHGLSAPFYFEKHQAHEINCLLWHVMRRLLPKQIGLKSQKQPKITKFIKSQLSFLSKMKCKNYHNRTFFYRERHILIPSFTALVIKIMTTNNFFLTAFSLFF